MDYCLNGLLSEWIIVSISINLPVLPPVSPFAPPIVLSTNNPLSNRSRISRRRVRVLSKTGRVRDLRVSLVWPQKWAKRKNCFLRAYLNRSIRRHWPPLENRDE